MKPSKSGHDTVTQHILRATGLGGSRPAGLGLWTVCLAAAIAGSPCGAVGSGSAQMTRALTAAPPGPLTGDWVEDWMAILRRVYQLMGGDPYYLDTLTLSQAMGEFNSYYTANGCPNDLTEQEKAAGRADVEELYDLTEPPAPLSGSTVSVLRQNLRSLYADLGGDPNTL